MIASSISKDCSRSYWWYCGPVVILRISLAVVLQRLTHPTLSLSGRNVNVIVPEAHLIKHAADAAAEIEVRWRAGIDVGYGAIRHCGRLLAGAAG